MPKPLNARRILFTADAKLGVKKFSAGESQAGQSTAGSQSPATLEGYALTWNTLSDDRGGYRVRLAPNSAVFQTPTRALYHHDFADIVGTTANNSLRLSPDDQGCKCEIDLPNTQLGRDVAALVQDGYISGMSFAMTPIDFTESQENGQKIVTFTKFLVDEVTITPIPAFASTSINVANDDENDEEEPVDPDADYAAQLAAESIRFERQRLALYVL